MSATSGICPDADLAITSNAFTAPTGCASFAHWTANVAVKVGDATVAAGSPIANGATIQDINSDITLTAVWKLAAPTITDKGDNTFSISGSIGGASYYYTIDGTTPTTSSSLYSAAIDFSAGEADITANSDKYGFGVGNWVPYLTINYVVKDKDGNTLADGSFMPMSASDGAHYGANINIPEGQGYSLTLSILSPAENGYLLHTDAETGVEGNFEEDWVTPYEVTWDNWDFAVQW